MQTSSAAPVLGTCSIPSCQERIRISRGPIIGRMTGDTPYMIATLHFESMQAMQQAFASEIGKACAADRRLFAPNDADSVMFLFDAEAA